MRRLLIAGAGVLLGLVGAMVTLAVLVLVEVGTLPPRTSIDAVEAAAWAGGLIAGSAGSILWFATVAVCFVPVAIVALIGEAAGSRSMVWYAGGTGVLTAALPSLVRAFAAASAFAGAPPSGRVVVLLFLTGVASGLVYWLVAGRSAGSS